MAIVLITHDLGVVAGMADRVHVMYAGRLVETAATRELFARPLHPYTRGLLASVPTIDDEGGQGDARGRLITIEGQPPDLAELPPGCAFAERCGWVAERCRVERPALDPVSAVSAGAAVSGAGARRSACFESDALAETP